MPTLKPRVAVTLEPHTHEVISRLAALQGKSRGAVISDLLESVGPSLARTVALLEAAFSAPDQIKDGLRAVIEGAHEDLAEAAGDGTKQLDLLMARIASPEFPDTFDPHVVTRGSGSGQTRGTNQQENPSKPGGTRVSGRSTKAKRTGGKDAV